MCGRYAVYTPPKVIAQNLGVKTIIQDAVATYNAAPGQSLPIVTNKEPLELEVGVWGFMPHWAKEGSFKMTPINARIESVAEKPLFRDALRDRRCVVPANGFFEWKKTENGKQPYYITSVNGTGFAFAGLWSKGEKGSTYCILTTQSTGIMTGVHDRMPVVVPRSQIKDWLRGSVLPEALLNEDLLWKTVPISKKVNSPKNNTPDILDPVPHGVVEE